MATTTVITNKGIEMFTDAMSSPSAFIYTPPLYFGWGTGSTPASASDTGLQTPSAESRDTGTMTVMKTTVTNDTVKIVGEITCTGAGKTISEVGIFDASTDGNMFVRSTFDGIVVGVGDSIKFTFKYILT